MDDKEIDNERQHVSIIEDERKTRQSPSNNRQVDLEEKSPQLPGWIFVTVTTAMCIHQL